MLRCPGSFLIASSLALASQSVVSTGSNYPALEIASMCAAHDCPVRAEYLVHDWGANPSGFAVISHAAGFYSQVSGGTLTLSSYWDTSGYVHFITLPTVKKLLTIRYQRDPAALTQSVEAWDADGIRIYQKSLTITNQADTGTGISIGTVSPGIDTGFVKLHTTLVPLNSRPPVASDLAAVYAAWMFENNLTDSGTRGLTLTMSAPSYTATPYMNPTAKARVWGAPAWTDTPAIRAGALAYAANRLDAGASYSPADASSAVSCAWSQNSGPTTVTWDNPSTCSPSITSALARGAYAFGLTVTDSASNTGNTTITLGAVATDDNWIVQYADPNTSVFFGPMIAFGRGPLGYSDYLSKSMSDGRYAQYIGSPYYFSATWPYISWQATQTGTVSYKWGGTGMDSYTSATGTTISSAIPASGDVAFTVSDISKIDITTLPTRVYIWTADRQWEEIRICTAVGSTLTPCTGGRGTADANSGRLAAQAWSSGAKIGQFKLTGSGTSFLSTLAPNPGTRKAVLHMSTNRSTDAYYAWGVFGCESNTACYLGPWPDGTGFGIAAGQQFSAVAYSYIDNYSTYLNQGTTGGMNFYGEGLAHRALCYQTGLPSYCDRADMIDDGFVLITGGRWGGSALYAGGPVIGAFADAVLSASAHKMTWPNLRGFADQGAAAVSQLAGNCSAYDSREAGYLLSFLNLAALFDPDTASTAAPGGLSWRAYWQSFLSAEYAAENGCRGSDSSWRNLAYFNYNGDLIHFTNGSATGTGTGIHDATCDGSTTGSGTATAGSGILTGSGFVSGVRIAITGTRSGQPFSIFQYYTVNSANQITLANGATWPGDSGAITWMVDGTEWLTTFMSGNTDSSNGNKAYSCKKVSSTQITLNRNWEGSTGDYYAYKANVAGLATQPFMNSKRIYAWKLASLAALATGNQTLANQFNSLRYAAASWAMSTGYDPVTKGFYYGVQPGCTPITLASMGNGVCYSATPILGDYNAVAERELAAEASDTLWAYFDSANGSTASVQLGDAIACALWGASGYTDATMCPADDGRTETSPYGASLNYQAGKWFGFFSGLGMRHQWPAIRLGAISTTTAIQPIGGQVAIGGKLALN